MALTKLLKAGFCLGVSSKIEDGTIQTFEDSTD